MLWYRVSMARQLVIFDFDGVIANSAKVTLEIWRIQCPHVTEADFQKVWNYNINEGLKLMEHTPECRRDLDFFGLQEPYLHQIDIFPGMRDTVHELAAQYDLAIISSNLSAFIRALLEKYEIGHHFFDILGHDVHAKKTEKIQMILADDRADPGQAVMITDTVGDIKEAREVGVGAIAVSWGFQPKEMLTVGEPFRIVDRPADIAPAIAAYFDGVRTSMPADCSPRAGSV